MVEGFQRRSNLLTRFEPDGQQGRRYRLPSRGPDLPSQPCCFSPAIRGWTGMPMTSTRSGSIPAPRRGRDSFGRHYVKVGLAGEPDVVDRREVGHHADRGTASRLA